MSFIARDDLRRAIQRLTAILFVQRQYISAEGGRYFFADDDEELHPSTDLFLQLDLSSKPCQGALVRAACDLDGIELPEAASKRMGALPAGLRLESAGEAFYRFVGTLSDVFVEQLALRERMEALLLGDFDQALAKLTEDPERHSELLQITKTLESAPLGEASADQFAQITEAYHRLKSMLINSGV
jgi:hypothetical protein